MLQRRILINTLRKVPGRLLTTTPIARDSPLDGSDINFAHPSGKYARTDDTINIRYPGHGFLREETPEHDGGRHFKRTLSSFSLEGKVCVVTGAARGLGYTMTQALIESGAEVAIVDLNQETAEQSAKELSDWFRQQDDDAAARHTLTTGWGCDVSNESQVQQAVANIIKKHGRIDCLVTSAGFTEVCDVISLLTKELCSTGLPDRAVSKADLGQHRRDFLVCSERGTTPDRDGTQGQHDLHWIHEC